MRRGRDKLTARRRALGHTQESLAEMLGVAVSTVARWEQGVGCPLPALRRPLADALSVSLDGLDCLLGGDGDIESKALTGKHADPFDRRGHGSGRHEDAVGHGVEGRSYERLLEGTAEDDVPRMSAEVSITDLPVQAQVAAVHRRYQAAEYCQASRFLPLVMESVDALVAEALPADRREALRLRCSVSIAAAKLATRAEDASLARLAADRAATAAVEADDPFGQAAAAYQLACALLKAGRTDQAELVAVPAANAVSDTGPHGMTWRGSLMLIGAIIAARRHDCEEAADRLNHAERLAERLGIDGNLGWTAFGPTNVRIHRMSAAVALDDPAATLAMAEKVDVVAIPPGLRGRQAQVHLDSAWAHVQLDQDPLALLHLLDAERVAPQIVYRDSGARGLIQEMLAREHRLRVPSLRGLASRAGVGR